VAQILIDRLGLCGRLDYHYIHEITYLFVLKTRRSFESAAAVGRENG
jgi:hypothetical protein